jgi:hypothetical protein
MHVSAELHRETMRRAENRCEYCGLAQAGQEARFHIDHVIPISAGGVTELSNLALACVSCSLRKGARQALPDPDSVVTVSIFNPRAEQWTTHFRWDGLRIVGRTVVGRATIEALRLNRMVMLAIRHEEVSRGRHPPPTR